MKTIALKITEDQYGDLLRHANACGAKSLSEHIRRTMRNQGMIPDAKIRTSSRLRPIPKLTADVPARTLSKTRRKTPAKRRPVKPRRPRSRRR
jgi:hypothetical protein